MLGVVDREVGGFEKMRGDAQRAVGFVKVATPMLAVINKEVAPQGIGFAAIDRRMLSAMAVAVPRPVPGRIRHISSPP